MGNRRQGFGWFPAEVLPDPCRGPSFLVSARKEAKKPTGEALNAGQLPRQSRPPRTPPGALLVQIVLDRRLFGLNFRPWL